MVHFFPAEIQDTVANLVFLSFSKFKKKEEQRNEILNNECLNIDEGLTLMVWGSELHTSFAAAGSTEGGVLREPLEPLPAAGLWVWDSLLSTLRGPRERTGLGLKFPDAPGKGWWFICLHFPIPSLNLLANNLFRNSDFLCFKVYVCYCRKILENLLSS